MKCILATLATVQICTAASAQYWKALGNGVNTPNEVQTLYGDSVSDRLLAGGTFHWIYNETDTVLGMGQAAWNGSRWDSLAHRIAPSVGQTFWFLRFQGKLYSCGGYIFLTPGGEANASLARLNEATKYWEALECINPDFGGMLTLVPKAPQNTLYATGYMGSVCGYPESCVFRYDGSAFHIWEPFNQIPNGNDNYVGTVFDYKGKTYMSCSVPDPVDGTGWVSFIRWNGTAWEHVPGWNTLSPIKEILIHDDTLFVAGTFTLADGGPGNLVAAFNGEQWSDMGGGLSYPPVPMSGAALDLEWFHGDLLACGRFTKAGNADCTGIAKWDGQKWCSFAGTILNWSGIDARIGDMTVWRDSLYICGGFNTIDGDTIRQVAQWIGGDAVEDCSTVGINETAAHSPALEVVPLAEPGRWRVQLPSNGPWALNAFDVMGREVGRWQAMGSMVVDLRGQSPGIYLLRASGPKGAFRSAKLVRP